jgi:hypothetical protein
MVGLLQADGGRIFLEGQEITKLPDVPAMPDGRRLSSAGVVGVPKAHGRRELLAILETLDLTRDESAASARTICWRSSI